MSFDSELESESTSVTSTDRARLLMHACRMGHAAMMAWAARLSSLPHVLL